MIRLIRRLIRRAGRPGPLEQARRAEKLREANRKMQQAAAQADRAQQCAEYLDRHARKYDRGE